MVCMRHCSAAKEASMCWFLNVTGSLFHVQRISIRPEFIKDIIIRDLYLLQSNLPGISSGLTGITVSVSTVNSNKSMPHPVSIPGQTENSSGSFAVRQKFPARNFRLGNISKRECVMVYSGQGSIPMMQGFCEIIFCGSWSPLRMAVSCAME